MAASPQLQKILARLEKVKGPDRAGWYTALCVFHPDQRRPNLRITETSFVCMACSAKGNLSALAAKLGLESSVPKSLTDRIVAEYDYHDQNGRVLFQVVRLHPKGFRQRRPDGNAGWRWGLKGITPVLFRMPELMKSSPAEPVFVVEGEKDADRLRAEGLTATCNPMGAGKWRREYNEALRGRHVVIIADNDEAGRKHAELVSSALQGVAASVRMVELPNLPDKGDVSDWLDAGNTVGDLKRHLNESPAIPACPPASSRLISAKDLIKKELPEPRWAVPELLPEGLAILGGKPKMGKSWLALNLGLAVATGGEALGSIRTEPGDVLYLALEDTERRLQSRLRDVLGDGAAPASLTFSCEWPRLDEGGLDELDLWLRTHPAARLVIVDTLAKIRPARGRSDTLYESDYASIAGLKDLADRYGVAILVIHHLRKMESADPVDAVSGTLGLAGAADAILVLKRERGKHDASLFATGRDLDEMEAALHWDDALCCWAIVKAEEEKQRISLARKQVLDALANQNAVALLPNQIAQLVGKGSGSVRKLLRDMEMDGQVVSEYGFYRLPLSSINSNVSNGSNSGNTPNSGNQELPAQACVTGTESKKVAALKPDLNLDAAQSYRVTAVTANGHQPPSDGVSASAGGAA